MAVDCVSNALEKSAASIFGTDEEASWGKSLLCREEQNRTGFMSEQRGSGGLGTSFRATSEAVAY
jgi:hypothetical protein